MHTLPSLKQILCPISGLKPEDMRFLSVVSCLGSESVVYAYGVIYVVVDRCLFFLLVLVQIQNHITQDGVKHLPASLTNRCWNKLIRRTCNKFKHRTAHSKARALCLLTILRNMSPSTFTSREFSIKCSLIYSPPLFLSCVTWTSSKHVSAISPQCHHKQVHRSPWNRRNNCVQWIRLNNISSNLLFLPSGSLQHLRITYPFLYSTALLGSGTCYVFKTLVKFTVVIKTRVLSKHPQSNGNAIVSTSRKGLAPINTACSPAAPAASANSSTSELLQMCTTQ